MSRLVARILFCMFMFPVGVVVYCSTIITMERTDWGFWSYWRSGEFEIAGVVVFAFVAAYWTLLWRKSVRWTPKRILVPIAAALVGIGVETLAEFIESYDREAHLILLAILVPALWLIATVYYWRETPAERASRFTASGRSNVACPTCGYNLTGLSEARCPECGAKFTLDELLASQPAQVAGEIE
jgi:uncharacterized paraquat-inducible protein A